MYELNFFTGFMIIISLFLVIFLIYLLYSRYCSLPCPYWLAGLIEIDNPFTKFNRSSWIIEHLDLHDGMVILDAGCGPGRLTIPLAKKIQDMGRVVGMDLQANMLDRVKEKVIKENLHNVSFLCAGLGEGKLPRETFDCVLLITVLGEAPHKEKAMREIFYSLKPGGILSVTEVIFDPHFQTQHTVITIATSAGFKTKQIFGNYLAFTIHLEKPL